MNASIADDGTDPPARRQIVRESYNELREMREIRLDQNGNGIENRLNGGVELGRDDGNQVT